MDFAKINQIASTDGFLPTKRIDELQNGVEYHVSKIRPSNTKWGVKIVAEIADDYKIYLPPRVSEAFLEDQTELEMYQVTATAGRLYIKFHDIKKKLFTFVLK